MLIELLTFAQKLTSPGILGVAMIGMKGIPGCLNNVSIAHKFRISNQSSFHLSFWELARGRKYVSLYLEVHSVLHDDKLRDNSATRNFSRNFHQVYNHSSLLPFKAKHFPNIVLVMKNTHDLDRITEKNYIHKSFNSEQVKFSVEFLKGCNKTAYVTSELHAHELAAELDRKGYKDVYVGSKGLSENIMGIRASNWLSTNSFLLKLRGAQSSGIWEWWHNLVKKHFTKTRRGLKTNKLKQTTDNLTRNALNDDEEKWQVDGLKKPDMKGNVLVIFSVWGMGCVLAISLFCVEIRALIRKLMVELKWKLCKWASLCCSIFKIMLLFVLRI